MPGAARGEVANRMSRRHFVRAKSSISSREPTNIAQIMSPNADGYVTCKTSPTLRLGVRSRIMKARLAL
jgi:hypothetical protein